jgi:hypothetical protein
LTKWNILCQPKEIGELGIKNIEIQYQCLLSKWLFKLINEEGIWQSLLRNKYLKNQTIAQVSKKNQGDSHFWAGLMNVKTTFLNFRFFALMIGIKLDFRQTSGYAILFSNTPALFNIVPKKNAPVASLLLCL